MIKLSLAVVLFTSALGAQVVVEPSGTANAGSVTTTNTWTALQTFQSGMSVTGGNVLFGATTTTDGALNYNPTNGCISVYASANTRNYGICRNSTLPANTVAMFGYFSGFGMIGASHAANSPMFTLMGDNQAGSGIAQTAFTVQDNNGVFTFNNTLDDNAGNIITRNPVAATSGTNQGGPTHIWRQNYWNGTVSSADDWKITPSLGTGTNPTSTWTLGYSGTSGAHSIALRAPVAITNAGANTTLTVAQANMITSSYSANLPTIAAGTGAGTTPTVAMVANSHTNGGGFTVTAGTTPTASATVVTVTFNTATGTVPANNVFCAVYPANVLTAALSGTAAVFVSSASSTASFVATVGSTALTAAGAYAWTYHCN
jgi:hypothetical protein